MTATALDQATIWYSACNEDAASEIAALQPAGKRILTITASGSRAFDLLLADPAEIVAIDENPSQTALAELFGAAYRHCDYSAFCGLVGLNDDPDRLARLDSLLPHVSDEAGRFWQSNRQIVADGLLYCGRWESFLRRFRRWAGPRRRALADQLLLCTDAKAQLAMWNGKWDDWQWRLFLRLLAVRWLWRHVLREPGIGYVPADFDMTDYARSRFDHAAGNLHLAQMPFAWLLFNGSYRADIVPPYLTELGHSVIRERLDRLTMKTASLQNVVTEAGPAAFDGASLSDYSSYCDEAEQRDVWHNLTRTMRPGAVVCERKFFNKTGMNIPIEFGFSRDEDLEERLNASDGAWFYTFVVARQAVG